MDETAVEHVVKIRTSSEPLLRMSCCYNQVSLMGEKKNPVHFTRRLDMQLRELLLHLQTLLNPAMSGAFTFAVTLGGWLLEARAAI